MQITILRTACFASGARNEGIAGLSRCWLVWVCLAPHRWNRTRWENIFVDVSVQFALVSGLISTVSIQYQKQLLPCWICKTLLSREVLQVNEWGFLSIRSQLRFIEVVGEKAWRFTSIVWKALPVIPHKFFMANTAFLTRSASFCRHKCVWCNNFCRFYDGIGHSVYCGRGKYYHIYTMC